MRITVQKVGRNDPCPCGSGRKYKHCCFARDRELASTARAGQAAVEEILQHALHLQELGQLEASAEGYERAIALAPAIAGAHYNLGNVRLAQGNREAAVACYRRALELQPDWSEACCNLGSALKELGRTEEAIALYRRTLARMPHDALVHYNLGNALKGEGELEAAGASFRKALSLDSKLDDAHWNLAFVLAEQRKPWEALASLREAASFRSKPDGMYSSLLFSNSLQAFLEPQEYLALARGWELEAVPADERLRARARIFQPAALDGRRLKVGYVSGDFRQHAVRYFLEQVLASHDRSRVEVFAYYTGEQTDEVTARFEAIVEHWAPVAKLTDAALLERIRAHGIDVLVDLSGHTSQNRLGVFARRAAPVQAHYLGYFASTGLTEMDYWIGDEIFTPPALDAAMSERVWRLPRTWISYGGDAQAPEPGGKTAADALCFGSFTNLNKVKASSLALWSRLLLALPGSRLLLKTKELAQPRTHQHIRGILASHGISAERVELLSSEVTPRWTDHMAYHDRLDVALDPIDAVSGGTTTCDALWMGVPVVSLLGGRMESRMTASLLHGLGRSEWIATSPDDYIAKVIELARDPARRAALRSTLRAQMAGSPLCDARDLAQRLEEAYAGMFEQRRRDADEQIAAAS